MKHPPCVRDCPGRSAECHSQCEAYLAYRAALNAEKAAREPATAGYQAAYRLGLARSERIRRKVRR